MANFTANVTSGCAPLTVSFTDQSTGGPTTWSWEISNGTLSSVQNPVISFGVPGTYSVKLVVTNASGISQVEKVDYITVNASPTASFTANLNLSCLPAPIQFADHSTSPGGTITQWEWDFGDGTTSTAQNPLHTYTSLGFFTITLKVTSSSGCTSVGSRGNYIRVVGGVTTDFNFSQPTTCRGPFPTNFQNESNGPGNVTYTWDFGNGQTSTSQNPTVIYNAAGSYVVKLNARSDLGCSGSIEKTITINGTATDFTAPPNACLNTPVDFQNSSSGAILSSTWNFGDGTTSSQINPVKTFLTAGVYTVKLINQYANCADSVSRPIIINTKPAVDFMAADSFACQAPFQAQFTDLTPGATAWLWDFGDGNTSTLQHPSHTYATTGNFSVTLTATTAAECSNTVTKTNFIQVRPVTLQLNTPAGGCVPFSYTPSSTIQTVDPVVSYLWDLGDGTTSALRNPPAHIYATPGTYTISLTVTTASGCTKTVSVPGGVRTGTPPVAIFTGTPTDACASQAVSFVNQSTIPVIPNAEVTYLWDFGDGQTSTDKDPTHQFADTGYRNVTLTVSNNGCENTSAAQVFHIKPPIAGFTYTVNCGTTTVVFQDTSIVDGSMAFTYDWDFGDGSAHSLVPNPTHTYPRTGKYNVTLVVTNGSCSSRTTMPVVVANEIADFTISKNVVCKNEPFTVTAANSVNGANIYSYKWTIAGIAVPDSSRSVRYSLPNTGTFDVTLVITDINGCVSRRTKTGSIRVTGPSASFTPATPGACLNKAVLFNDLSTPAGTIQRWDFDFGDSIRQPFTAPPFNHVYAKEGHFIVKLKVTDNLGCTDDTSINLTVTNPRAGFASDTFYCPGINLPFRDTSSGAGLTYQWQFGDGHSSTLQNPENAYPVVNAEYTVKLKVTDISGCTDSISKLNYIRIRSPKAAFTIKDTTTICAPLHTSFFFHGSDYASFYWDFGDGGTSSLPDPSYYYSSIGTFTPKLYTLGNGGCIDSAQSSVTVYDPTTSQINYGPVTTACNSLNVDFNLVLPPGFKFYFYFGDGSVDSTRRTSFSHLYGTPGFSTPYLVLFDSIGGCQSIVRGRTRIDVLGALPLFGIDKKEFCDSGLVNFTDFTVKNEPILSTAWDFGDGGTSNVKSPSHTYTQPGMYLVNLTITTQSNCSKTYTDTVMVYRTPVPYIAGRDTVCINVAEPYAGSIAVPDTLTNWKWDLGNGQSSTAQNASGLYTQPGDYTLQLITSNKLGCSSTVTKTIYAAPPPTAIATQDPVTIISGGGTPLPMTYTGPITSYAWTPAYRLDCSNCPIPFASPQFTTTYNVALEDRYGCRGLGEVTVTVVCNNQNFFIPNTFSPNGDAKNEWFYPRGTGLFRIKSMTVFNRWGQVMFSRKDFVVNDPLQGWDGKYKGAAVSADVYVYMIEILCDNNTVIPVKGNVTLLR